MINLKPKHLQIINNILKEYCPKAEIWAYGSRINGASHDGRDLDLTVISFNEENKSTSTLKTLFDESNLTFYVDITEYNSLPLSFQQEINKNYIKLFP